MPQRVGRAGALALDDPIAAYLPEEDLVVVVLTNNFDSEIVEDLTIEAQAVALGEA